jgi:hypothetical protein
MISTMATSAPADLLGLGGVDVRRAFGAGLCGGYAQYLAAPVNAPIAADPRTGLPAGRLRRVTWHAIDDVVENTTFTFENNGTTLGNLSPGRPQS